MHARLIALCLAATTGCATASAPAPRLFPSTMAVGSMGERTQFELDDSSTSGSVGRDAPDDDVGDTDKKKRRRKILFFVGLAGVGFGGVGFTGFGIGGRVVQGQMANAIEDNSLTRDEKATLTTRGEVLNALAITSAVIGIAGVLTASIAYGIDHARCGDLPPRRANCPDRDEAQADPPPAEATAQ
ncbi:MAG: hypothetical protein K0V04_26615 [Deltaproteobacteria bacterium]|nr:hypothetical protein [Deltaproteobacteria bacterium]